MTSHSDIESPPANTQSRNLWTVWGLVYVSLLAFSAIRSPVPGVNEPHYLCKAKHYWDPSWCAGDFFLESSNAHAVFFQTVGAFTQVFTLEQTAWIGRLAALALLAWGWVRCVSYLVPGRWASLWAMWIYLAFAAAGNWSGEWIVGGVEGKVFAYGFGFWAIALWWERRIILAGLIAGLSVSFHPVVGGWFVVSAIAATLLSQRFAISTNQSNETPPAHSLQNKMIAVAVFALAAMPGIWPAIGLLQNTNSAQADQVALIQTFDRIRHHLDPMTFSQGRNVAYGFLLVLWLLLQPRRSRSIAEQWFFWFTATAIALALAGVALGYGDRPLTSVDDITWRYRLLKFYPFRLADIMLPAAVAITLAGLLSRGLQDGRLESFWGPRSRSRNLCWLLCASCLMFSLAFPAIDRNPSRMSEQQLEDWLNVCQWVRQETPEDAMFWIQSRSWAFKWYAQRAEYASRKDCPQDAAGILEWKKRRGHQLSEAFEAESRLNFAILQKGRGALEIEPIYENSTYRVYDLSSYRNPE